jgi:hypothetical protein
MKKNLIILFILSSGLLMAQVDAIKSASNNAGKSGGGDRKSSNNGVLAYFFVDLFINNVVPWQIQTLQKKDTLPELVSLELRLQTGLQPSNYYLALPRMRANWGLFSTDYRRSYLVEYNPLGTTKDISWNDWQVLQLNILNTTSASFRIGAGIMNEVFNGKNTYPEYTMALSVRPRFSNYNGEFEFRTASDLATASTPRWELNAHVNKKLFNRGRLHSYLTGGGVFQQYYNKTNIWAFTAGLVFKIF